MSTRILHSFLNLYPNLKEELFNLKNKMIKAHLKKLQFNFLRQCKQEGVIPNSLRMGRKISTFDDVILLETLLLSQHIKYARQETKQAFLEYERAKAIFVNKVDLNWKQNVFNYLYNKLRTQIKWKKVSLEKKLKKLIEESIWNRIGKEANYINLSDKRLKPMESKALSLGLNFSTSFKKPNLVEINKALHHLNSTLEEEKLMMAKGMIYYNYILYNECNLFPVRYSKALLELKKDESIHITRADKAKVIVILNKVDYIRKMEDLLNDENTYTKLRKNPLMEVNKNFHVQIKQIFGNDSESIKKFSSRGSRLPYLYGVVKTHKLENPLRPIISTVSTVTSKLSSFLVKILQPIVGTISKGHISNNTEFTDELNKVETGQDQKMASFDVTSLFTNVPIELVLDHLQSELENLDLPYTIPQVSNLIKLCVKGTCFTFSGKYYRQDFGMQMGGKLSPIMANIFMEIFEEKIAKQIIGKSLVWRRYVDDVFSVWKKHQDLAKILDLLNNLVPTIKFTVENEANNQLPFLDVMVIRSHTKFDFKIYRKATNNQLIINKHSKNTDNTKRSAITHMFLRALKIVSPRYMDEEFNIIKTIGEGNGFDINFIERCKQIATKTFYNTLKNDQWNDKNCLTIPYHVNFESLNLPLKLLGIKVAFKYDSTIEKILIRNSPKYSEGIVYKINCQCGKFYIGQTSVSLEERVKQHQLAVRRGDDSNACNLHYCECDKSIMWKEATTIYKINDFYNRNFIETVCIGVTSDINFNTSEGLYKIDSLTQHLVEKQYKIKKMLSS